VYWGSGIRYWHRGIFPENSNTECPVRNTGYYIIRENIIFEFQKAVILIEKMS
jgi:hypothetical protein